MYIIVIGGGKVGFSLTKALLDEGHEVVVLEKDQARTDFISGELGSVAIRGDGCELNTLSEVGTGRADMFVAVTGDDEDNLVSCQIAKHRFNVPVTVARINDPNNETIFKLLGIDVPINSTMEILEHIEQRVPTHPLTHLLTLKEEGVEIVEVRIPPTASAVGKAIKDIALPEGTTIGLIIGKKHKPYLPTPNSVLEADDQVIAATPPEREAALRTALRGK